MRILTTIFLSIMLILASSSGITFAPVSAGERPTTNYLIFYDAGQSKTVSAGSVDEALQIFRAETKHEIIYSVSRKSYVSAVWIRGK